MPNFSLDNPVISRLLKLLNDPFSLNANAIDSNLPALGIDIVDDAPMSSLICDIRSFAVLLNVYNGLFLDPPYFLYVPTLELASKSIPNPSDNVCSTLLILSSAILAACIENSAAQVKSFSYPSSKSFSAFSNCINDSSSDPNIGAFIRVVVYLAKTLA